MRYVKSGIKETHLGDFNKEDIIIVPGGFSYGDYVRAGAIARFSPIMQAVIQHADAGGLVWGICNGFQILCEAHLLPGALLRNAKQKFIGKNCHLRVESTDTRITNQYSVGEVLKIPIAHAEGRYHANPKVLENLNRNNQILFRYCDSQGDLKASANENGSLDHIAGICNERRNVFGMMAAS